MDRHNLPILHSVLCLIKWLTDSMEQSPKEADSQLAIQEISRLLWKSKVH